MIDHSCSVSTTLLAHYFTRLQLVMGFNYAKDYSSSGDMSSTFVVIGKFLGFLFWSDAYAFLSDRSKSHTRKFSCNIRLSELDLVQCQV
jgi:hypothetical protein